MSKKQNRIRARRARQQQELLSLRAELLLLYDGAPMPNHYLEVDRLTTREYVRQKKWQLEHFRTISQPTPSTFTGPSVVQMQIDIAAEKLRADIDKQLITELREVMGKPSLDK